MFTRLAASLLFTSFAVALTPNSVSAQAPSPLELVRGLREHGEPKLSLEYLKLAEKNLPPADVEVVPLDRGHCTLEVAITTPKADTRKRLLGEAQAAFDEFLKKNANHPRALEASFGLARLMALQARVQLRTAEGIAIPVEEGPDREKALDSQREELAKARALIEFTSKQFAELAAQTKLKLDALPPPDPLRPRLARDLAEAELASAIQRYHVTQTYLGAMTGPTLPRDTHLEKARRGFEAIARGPQTNPTTFVARAWMAEVLADQGKLAEGRAEFAGILNTPRREAEEGKRLARFFQIRRDYIDALTEGNVARLVVVEQNLRTWLLRYGAASQTNDEVVAARYFLAISLQRQAIVAIARLPINKKPVVLPEAVRKQLEQAETLYRIIGLSDNDYSERATKNLATVVRWLGGDVVIADPAAPKAAALGVFESRKGPAKAKLIKDAGGTDESEAAVAAGLAWLARHQKQDGGWEYEVGDKNERIAATGMALLAFLGAGESHTDKGKYQKTVKAAVDYLAKNCPAEGAFKGKMTGNAYAQAIGTLALCEAYGMSRDEKLLPTAQAAIDYIVKGQAPNGSWGYAPGNNGDTSIVGWQIQALKAARASKDIKVPDATFKKAVDFLNFSGAGARKAMYGYTDNAGAAPATSLTAIGLWCRANIDGWSPDNAGMVEGVTGLLKRKPVKAAAVPDMYFYYYATQVLRVFEGEEWRTWNEGAKGADGLRKGGMRDWLISIQNKKEGANLGSFDPDAGWIGRSCGRVGTTAIAVLTLEVYYRSPR